MTAYVSLLTEHSIQRLRLIQKQTEDISNELVDLITGLIQLDKTLGRVSRTIDSAYSSGLTPSRAGRDTRFLDK